MKNKIIVIGVLLTICLPLFSNQIEKLKQENHHLRNQVENLTKELNMQEESFISDYDSKPLLVKVFVISNHIPIIVGTIIFCVVAICITVLIKGGV